MKKWGSNMIPVLKKSLFGFRREDVVNFISNQSKHYEKKIAELEEENKKAFAEHRKEREELSQDRTALEELKNKLSTNQQTISDFKNQVEELKEKTLDFSTRSVQAEEKLRKLLADMELMHQRLLFAESFREKAEKFDQLSSVLNSIVNGREVESAGHISLDEPKNVALENEADILDSFAEYKAAGCQIGETAEQLLLQLERMDFSI
jgi:chromosome segregation ATPase